jgi:hypothetical protein
MNARKNTWLAQVLPEDNPEKEFIDFISEFNTALTPLAFAMSYYRNRSLKWAVIHTLLATPYVAYVMVDVLARKAKEEEEL